MKRRSLVQPPLLLALVIGAIVLMHYQLRLGLLALGVLGVVIAVGVELQSKNVWRSYKRNWHPGRNKMLNSLQRPREIYHLINVYLLWPAVFLLGLWAVWSALSLG